MGSPPRLFGGADRGRAPRPAALSVGARGLASCASLSVALVTVLAGRLASAEEERPIAEALEIAPHECLDVTRLTPDLARVLGRQTLDARVSVAIASETGGVKITVRFAGADRGVRHIGREARCDDYVSIVAITVAMAIEALVPHEPPPSPDAARAQDHDVLGEGDASPTAPRAAPARTVADVGAPPAIRPAPRAVVRPSVRGYVQNVSNIVPEQAWSFGTAVTLRGSDRGPRGRLGTSIVFPTDVAVGESSIEASALVVDVDGCLLPLRDFRPLRACAGVYFGAVFARGTAEPFARRSVLPFVHAHAGAEIVLPLGGAFSGVLGVDVLAGLLRPRLVIEGLDDHVLATRVSPLFGGLVRAGVEWGD